MADPIQIADPSMAEVQPTITISDVAAGTSYPQQTASTKAAKADFGMRGMSDKSYDDYYTGFMRGDEPDMRQTAASEVDFSKVSENRKAVMDLASRGKLDEFTPPPMTSPGKVFEESFADRYMNTLKDTARKSSTWIDGALMDIPEQTEYAFQKGSRTIWQSEFIRGLYDKAQALHDQNSNFGWALDKLSTMTPGYNQLFLGGHLDTSWYSAFVPFQLGEHLENQAIKLYNIKDDNEFMATAQKTYDYLKANPELLMHWLGSMMTPRDRVLDNIFSGLDWTNLASLKLSRSAQLFNKSMKTSRDMFESVPLVGRVPPRSAAAAGAGDMGEAATVQQAANRTAEFTDLHYNPEKQIWEELPSSFKANADAMRKDPGDFREVSTRLANEVEAQGGNFLTVVENQMKVNRTPWQVESENAVRAYKDAIIASGKYRGVENQVINMHGPVYDNLTNTYNYEIRLGAPTGEYFKNQIVAVNNAILNNMGVADAPRVLELQDLIFKTNKQLESYKALDVPDPFNTLRAKLGLKDIVQPTEAEAAKLRVQAKQMERRIKSFELNAKDPRFNAAEQEVWKKRADAFRKERDDLQDRLSAGTKSPKYAETRAGLEKQLEDYNKEFDKLINKRQAGFAVAEQKGLGWYIARTVPKHEIDDIVRMHAISPPATTSKEHRAAAEVGASTSIPPAWAGAWLQGTVGWIRTPENVLSIAENAQRKIATFGPNVLLPELSKMGKPLTQIPSKHWEDFNRLLRAGQRQVSLETGQPGVLWKTAGEVQDWYQRNIGRLPSESELAANFAYNNLMEAKHMLENLRAYTDKHRLGTSTWHYSIQGDDKQILKSPEFDGFPLNRVPRDEENILIPNANVDGGFQIVRSDKLKKRDEWTDKVTQGQVKLISVVDPASRPFSELTPARIGYVMHDRLDFRPLDINQKPRPVNVVPESKYSIKQARIFTERSGKSVIHFYEGDNNLMAIEDAATGNRIIKHLDQVNQYLSDGRGLMARTHNDMFLPFDWDTHKSWYTDYQVPGGPTRLAALRYGSPGTKFYLVPKGQKIWDIEGFGKEFETLTSTGNVRSLLRNGLAHGHGTELEPPRELYTVRNDRGSNHFPLFEYVPTNVIDPVVMLDRGLNKTIQNAFNADMKIYVAEHWLKMAEQYLNPGEGKSVWDAPMHNLYHLPPWRPNTPPEIKSNLMSMRRKSLDFVGVPGQIETWLHQAAQKMADAAAEEFAIANKKFAKTTGNDIVPFGQLPYVRNPMSFMKSITYTAYMGLLTVKQLWNQLSQFSAIYARSPLSAPAATWATYLYTLSRINRTPEILDHLDKLAYDLGHGVKMRNIPGVRNFMPGQFKEFLELMESTGYHRVGSEHANLSANLDDTFLSPRIVKGIKDKILEIGQTPLRLGSAATRVGSYAAAYLERRATVSGALSRLDKEWILSRAASLDHHMSRASSSWAHTGIASVPAQFWAYNIRSTELVYSRSVPPLEKARMLLFSSLLFGLPVGAAGLTAMPLAPYIHKKASQLMNYTVGYDIPTSTLMEGAGALVMATISGGGNPKKGNWYDFSKLGPGGVNILGDILDNDKTIWDIVGGAPKSLLFNTWQHSSGFRMWAGGILSGKSDFKLKPEHMIDLVREAATVKDTYAGVIAFNTGKWYSANETLLGKDVSKWDAAFMAISGFHHAEWNEAYNTAAMKKEQEETYKWQERQFEKEYRRGMMAEEAGNHTQAIDYYTNANKYLLSYPLERRARALAQAVENNKTLKERVDWDWAMKNVPPEELPARIERLRRMQQIQENKK